MVLDITVQGSGQLAPRSPHLPVDQAEEVHARRLVLKRRDQLRAAGVVLSLAGGEKEIPWFPNPSLRGYPCPGKNLIV